MIRTAIALLVTLITAVLIVAFQIISLDLTAVQVLTEQLYAGGIYTIDIMVIGATLFGVLLFPYTAAMAWIYSPLVALGVAGFIAGLITKNGVRMLFVSIIAIVLFFLGFYIPTFAGDPNNFAAMFNIARSFAIDFGVVFSLLFIPGIIGASLTAEDY